MRSLNYRIEHLENTSLDKKLKKYSSKKYFLGLKLKDFALIFLVLLLAFSFRSYCHRFSNTSKKISEERHEGPPYRPI